MRFRYCLDPIFLTAVALYLLNKFALKPLEGAHGGFFHSFGNDLLCIPFCLPPVLYFYRVIGLRSHDKSPTRFELVSHLVIWSLVFEWIAPHIGGPFAWTVGDPLDVIAYCIGGLIAWVLWQRLSGLNLIAQICPAEEAT